MQVLESLHPTQLGSIDLQAIFLVKILCEISHKILEQVPELKYSSEAQ